MVCARAAQRAVVLPVVGLDRLLAAPSSARSAAACRNRDKGRRDRGPWRVRSGPAAAPLDRPGARLAPPREWRACPQFAVHRAQRTGRGSCLRERRVGGHARSARPARRVGRSGAGRNGAPHGRTQHRGGARPAAPRDRACAEAGGASGSRGAAPFGGPARGRAQPQHASPIDAHAPAICGAWPAFAARGAAPPTRRLRCSSS